MAKAARKKKVPCVRHSWEVFTEEEPCYCECDDECNCYPPSYAVAECRASGCKARLSSYDIEMALNELEMLKNPTE